MASGDTLLIFTPQASEPPASNYATLDTRNNHLVLDFDDSTDETIYFKSVMPQAYAGGGVTVYLFWAASSATSGNAILDVAFENLASQDLDSNGFAAVNSTTDTANATNGVLTTASIAFTDGADMDSVTAGNPFRISVTRDANNASDTMTGDLELLTVEIRET